MKKSDFTKNEPMMNWKRYPNGHVKASSTIIEGKEVINLTPDFDRRLALIDFEVLNKIIEFLPTQGFSMFKTNLKMAIGRTEKLEEIVEICENFVAFHKTVNLIKEVCLDCPKEIQKDEQPSEDMLDEV